MKSRTTCGLIVFVGLSALNASVILSGSMLERGDCPMDYRQDLLMKLNTRCVEEKQRLLEKRSNAERNVEDDGFLWSGIDFEDDADDQKLQEAAEELLQVEEALRMLQHRLNA